ncbi:GlcG/HbpS family heme-binding protein [Halopseudomonas sp.]|uniref:GlcG/HbpS family heme-binding protein n=1 Tax=Halopseudomonas sp. TaxID=2901191 RepID=UPI003002BE76
MRHRLSLFTLLLGSLAAGAVQAGTEGVVARQDLTLALGNQLTQATLSACHAQDRSAVVAVVDRSGQLVALQRDDNVGPHNTLAAQRKAFTALSTKTATSELAKRAQGDASSANLNTLDELLLLGGGLPIVVDGQVVGALGVAGAGGSSIDESCAQSAIDQVLQPTK